MGEFNAKSLCILGRQPAIGVAELERLYKPQHVQPIDGAALLDIPAEEINFKRLGGTIKTARVLNILPTTNWGQLIKYLHQTIPKHLVYLSDGKFTLGLSTYGFNVTPSQINKDMLKIKKLIRSKGRSVRIVPNKATELNSAQVLNNKLTSRGAWELIYIRHKNKTILAQTMFVQNINEYAARDQARPKRDARVGMLPPKLAQIMINLAVGDLDKSIPADRVRILDPFCGTGVVLQEALLIGYSTLGSDIEPRMVEYAKENIGWLAKKYPQISGHAAVEIADATSCIWPKFSTVVSETYLGRPLNSLPSQAELDKIVKDVDTILRKFIKNLHPQLPSGKTICLAVPAWRDSKKLIQLPLIAKLTDMGYNRVDLKHVREDELVYFRENQTVTRQLLVISKK